MNSAHTICIYSVSGECLHVLSFPQNSGLSYCWLGVRKSIQPITKWLTTCWCGYLSGTRFHIVCIWSTWCHSNCCDFPCGKTRLDLNDATDDCALACSAKTQSSLVSFTSSLVLPNRKSQQLATYVLLAWSLCLYVWLLLNSVSHKMRFNCTEWNVLLFGMWTHMWYTEPCITWGPKTIGGRGNLHVNIICSLVRSDWSICADAYGANCCSVCCDALQ